MKVYRFFGVLSVCTLVFFSACKGCRGDNNGTTSDMSGMADMVDGGDMGCVAGAAGCACTMENTCEGDLMCVDGKCTGVETSGLTINTAEARACEIMLEEKGGQVVGATYAEGVKGAFRRKSPRVAFAISMTEDSAFPASTVQVQVPTGSEAPEIKSVSCSDAEGKEIADSQATLQ